MRPHKEPGIRRNWRGNIKAYVRVGGQLRTKRYKPGTSLDTVRRWRADVRTALTRAKPAAGTLTTDIEPFLRQIAHRPTLVKERRQQLTWWATRFRGRSRHSLTAGEIREALADLRKTHAPTTCNHYRQALLSLYTFLDGKDAPNPVRNVAGFAPPEPEPRGLSYDLVRLILDAMSDQGALVGKGQSREAGSKAKARCRVLAYTGMRPSELKRYRPEHWNRAEHTLIVLTGKKGKYRTIPVTEDAEIALAAFESLDAFGNFSTSTVHRAFRLALTKLGLEGIRPYDLGLPRFRGRVRTWVSSARGELSPLVVDG